MNRFLTSFEMTMSHLGLRGCGGGGFAAPPHHS